MRGHSAEPFEAIFTEPGDVNIHLRPGVIAYRTGTVWHGPMATVKAYPIWDVSSGERGRARAAMQSKGTSKAQQRINHRNAQDKIVQLANTNFGPGDIMVTNTYLPGCGPADDAEARRDFRNYRDRLKRIWKKLGKGELKYIATIEKSESPRDKNETRYHIHVLLNAAGVDRDLIEAAWGLGTSNTERYQHQENYFSGFAGYMAVWKPNQKKATKRQWLASKNLNRPRKTVSDKKLTMRRMERLAAAMQMDGRAILEKAYPGYRVVGDIIVRRSAFVGGAYIYANLRRIDDRPPKRHRPGTDRAKGAGKRE